LIHGDDDHNVPFQQTTDLVEKLRAQNVAFEELIIPADWLPRANGNKPTGA